MNLTKSRSCLTKIVFITVFLFTLFNIQGQQIVNLRTAYENDTLIITYDILGKSILDSLGIKVSAQKSKKSYSQVIKGENQSGVSPGKDKIAKIALPRYIFPDEGESFKIQLVGWLESSVKIKKGNRRFGRALTKTPKNPRFSLIFSGGVILPSSEFSEIGLSKMISLYYQPAAQFKVGIGFENMSFQDTLNSFYIYPYFINLVYELSNLKSTYLMMKLGYSQENMGPVISVGGGYQKILKGPVGIDLGVSLHKFYGNRDFVTFGLKAGLSLNVSSRFRYKREKVYKFRKYLLYMETGINYLQEITPNFSFEIAYNILPFYTQSIGLSFEVVHYQGTYKIYRPYYSTYYKSYKQFILFEEDYIVKYKIIPLYLSGRLFLSPTKIRPFLQWKYGLSLYSDANEGSLANGFMAGLGIGIQVPFNRSSALILSSGLKYFKNEYTYSGSTNYYFGSFSINAGIVF